MKVKFDGKKQSIPMSWDEVTWEQFMKLTTCITDGDVIGLFLNIKPEKIRQARIENLESLLSCLAFLKQEMPIIVPKSILGYAIPKDLNFETVGQFEDMKDICSKLPTNGEKLTAEHLGAYLEMVGVYAMPNYLDSTLEHRTEFANQFNNAPCTEVMAVGNFTVKRLTALINQQAKGFQKVNTQQSKFRLALRGWLARTASSIHFYTWKKRLPTNGTN